MRASVRPSSGDVVRDFLPPPAPLVLGGPTEGERPAMNGALVFLEAPRLPTIVDGVGEDLLEGAEDASEGAFLELLLLLFRTLLSVLSFSSRNMRSS